MNRTLHTTALSIISALILSACTQPGVDVVMKGTQYYGRNAGQEGAAQPVLAARPAFEPTFEQPTYQASAELAPISVETVDVPSAIAVNDMPPPSAITYEAPVASNMPADVPFETARVEAQPMPAPMVEPMAVSTLSAETLAPLEPLASFEAPAEPIVAPVQVAAAEPMVAPAILSKPSVTQLESINKAMNSSTQFIWPVEGKIVSRFGPKSNGLVNDGINIATSAGEPIWAASGGEVVYSGNELKGYGNMVIIRHPNGWMSAYAHASDILVTKGDKVAQGDLLGYVGSTGSVTEPQLHFGLREGTTPVNPETLLPRRLASN